MRTELQYNLQKARALATELRCTIEAITESEDFPFTSDQIGQVESIEEQAGNIETFFDDDVPELIGKGHVKLTVEPFS